MSLARLHIELYKYKMCRKLARSYAKICVCSVFERDFFCFTYGNIAFSVLCLLELRHLQHYTKQMWSGLPSNSSGVHQYAYNQYVSTPPRIKCFSGRLPREQMTTSTEKHSRRETTKENNNVFVEQFQLETSAVQIKRCCSQCGSVVRNIDITLCLRVPPTQCVSSPLKILYNEHEHRCCDDDIQTQLNIGLYRLF